MLQLTNTRTSQRVKMKNEYLNKIKTTLTNKSRYWLLNLKCNINKNRTKNNQGKKIT